jgi:hypothetical protein
MKKSFIGAIVAVCLAAGPALAFAQSTSSATKAATPATPAKKAAAAPAVHAMSGVVKSIDGSMLVITKVAGKGPETSFVVNSATQKQGTLAAGASVDVRYHTEGKDKIATAISVQTPKAATAKTSAKSSTTPTKK